MHSANPFIQPDLLSVLVILGPTATGKTRLAAQVSARLGGEVISADSRQVYRGLDLGTGKDYADYRVGDRVIPSHLIDLCEPGEEFNVFKFQQAFIQAASAIQTRGNLPVLCGGTGLYLQAALQGYRLIQIPENPGLRIELGGKDLVELAQILSGMKKLHNKTDLTTAARAIRAIEIETWYRENPGFNLDYPRVDSLLIGLNIDRNSRRRRITERLRTRLAAGMVDEVRNLLAGGVDPRTLEALGLEYRYLTRFVTGHMDEESMFRGLNTAIHQFAKRQMTWFRKMEREGFQVHWLDALAPENEKLDRVLSLVEQKWPGRWFRPLP